MIGVEGVGVELGARSVDEGVVDGGDIIKGIFMASLLMMLREREKAVLLNTTETKRFLSSLWSQSGVDAKHDDHTGKNDSVWSCLQRKHLSMSICIEHETVMHASTHGPAEEDRSNQRIVFLVHYLE